MKYCLQVSLTILENPDSDSERCCGEHFGTLYFSSEEDARSVLKALVSVELAAIKEGQ